MRAFFAEGVEKSFLPLVVEAMPTLLHISLFLFFAGLVVFLWNVDLTIFKMVLSWVGVCTALYGLITSIPIFRHDSPYYTPLTPLARTFVIVTLKVFLVAPQVFFYIGSYSMKLPHRCFSFMVSPDLCCCCCCGGFLCCACFHSFWSSCLNVCRSAPRHLSTVFSTLYRVLGVVLDTTLMAPEEAARIASASINTRAFMWTFDSLDEDDELERFFSSLPNFCSSNVVDDPLPDLTVEGKHKISGALFQFLRFTFSSSLLPEAVKHQRAIMCAKALDLTKFSPGSANNLHTTIRWRKRGLITDNNPTDQAVFVQGIATWIVTQPQRRDDSWFQQVAPNALGVSETVLRDYAANGDSLSLAILIHVTRQQFTYFRYSTWPTSDFRELVYNSRFNARNASPELQHKFCTLWNQIVLEAQEVGDLNIVENILNPITDTYFELHRDTDSAPTSYGTSPWTGRSRIQGELSSFPVCKVPGHVHVDSAPTFSTRAIPHDTTTFPHSLASPPSSIPATSAPFSSGPPSTVALQHNTGQLEPSVSPNLPSSASLDPVLPPTGPSQSSHSPITRPIF